MVRILVDHGATVRATDSHGRDIVYYLRNVHLDDRPNAICGPREPRQIHRPIKHRGPRQSLVRPIAPASKTRPSLLEETYAHLSRRGYCPSMRFADGDTLLHALVRARAFCLLFFVIRDMGVMSDFSRIKNKEGESVLDSARRCHGSSNVLVECLELWMSCPAAVADSAEENTSDEAAS